MLPLSPAYFAFAAAAITLYWICYRWTTGRLLVLLGANFFFLARFAWFYPLILSGRGNGRLPRRVGPAKPAAFREQATPRVGVRQPAG